MAELARRTESIHPDVEKEDCSNVTSTNNSTIKIKTHLSPSFMLNETNTTAEMVTQTFYTNCPQDLQHRKQQTGDIDDPRN